MNLRLQLHWHQPRLILPHKLLKPIFKYLQFERVGHRLTLFLYIHMKNIFYSIVCCYWPRNIRLDMDQYVDSWLKSIKCIKSMIRKKVRRGKKQKEEWGIPGWWEKQIASSIFGGMCPWLDHCYSHNYNTFSASTLLDEQLETHQIYNKKFELMLTRRAKAYSNSGSVV